MVHAGGHPVPSLINDNFEHLDKVANSSGHYFWKCKHCGHLDNSPGIKIQGHDNSLHNHIICHCKDAAPELCQKARTLTFIMNKTVTGDDGDQVLSPAASSSSGAMIKKRKKISTLDGYVDYPLSDEQAKLANVKLLRFIIHTNFAWMPPLTAKPQDVDDLLAGLETILADEIAEAFNALEVQENLEEFVSINNTEVIGGKAFNFVELERVDRGLVPQAAVDCHGSQW
ncbi:hypothetical protein BDR05DRAFT_1000994 [Suillus weaverae]|nr:hypothetical protein BDR05DRAFT_1000994 [Suillus weaverae]